MIFFSFPLYTPSFFLENFHCRNKSIPTQYPRWGVSVNSASSTLVTGMYAVCLFFEGGGFFQIQLLVYVRIEITR